jgi:hypothetical protein
LESTPADGATVSAGKVGLRSVFSNSYLALLVVSALLGVASAFESKALVLGALCFAIIPAYALVDAIRNRDLLCPVRAGSLPLVAGAAHYVAGGPVDAFLILCMAAGITAGGSLLVVLLARVLSGGRPNRPTHTRARARPGVFFTRDYGLMLIVAAMAGIATGAFIEGRKGSLDLSRAYEDTSFVVTFLIVVPLYVLVDSLRHSDYLRCTVRAASLPLVAGLVIYAITGWVDPLLVSCVAATITIGWSLLVVTIRRLGGRRVEGG